MKISVITVCFNSEATIEKTILSVLAQSYENIEYIVVDGKSSDQTKNIIQKYSSQIQFFISEKDNGIFDAMNKGLNLATGEYIAFLNSDDSYTTKNSIQNIVNLILSSKSEFIYGDLLFKYDDDKYNMVWRPGLYSKEKLRTGWIIPHPTMFVHRSLFQKFGFFDVNYPITADYELILRMLLYQKTKVAYLPRIITNMRPGGNSKKLIKKLPHWIEIYKIFKKYGFQNPFLLLLKKHINFKRHIFTYKDKINLE